MIFSNSLVDSSGPTILLPQLSTTFTFSFKDMLLVLSLKYERLINRIKRGQGRIILK